MTTINGQQKGSNPFAMAAKGKGVSALLKRGQAIMSRYGLTASKMDKLLAQFAGLLQRYNCRATFPVTSVALARNAAVIQKYQAQGIEFAVHGYTHIDYSQLSPEEQLHHLRWAREIFSEADITAVGFRSPYLRRHSHLNEAIKTVGFDYVSNQPIFWDVLETDTFSSSTMARYERALDFYTPWYANKRPSLPRLDSQIVEIPVSLPDDEILVDRLDGNDKSLVEKAWLRILDKIYQRDELFTIQLHPERIVDCATGLSAVLAEAAQLDPAVWFARLDEIAAWWQDRFKAKVEITEAEGDKLHLAVSGPKGTTVLARGHQVDVPTSPWANGYQLVQENSFTIQGPIRPFIGISPESPSKLISFLQQQGYIIEVSQEAKHYPYYLNQSDFNEEDESSVLAQIEESDCPLVRLGRWPDGSRSALVVTGDIDALTLWDYGLRILGR